MKRRFPQPWGRGAFGKGAVVRFNVSRLPLPVSPSLSRERDEKRPCSPAWRRHPLPGAGSWKTAAAVDCIEPGVAGQDGRGTGGRAALEKLGPFATIPEGAS